MKTYSKHELFDVLKSLDSDTLLILNVFPFFESEPLSFFSYSCGKRSAICLINLLSPETRYTFKIIKL